MDYFIAGQSLSGHRVVDRHVGSLQTDCLHYFTDQSSAL